MINSSTYLFHEEIAKKKAAIRVENARRRTLPFSLPLLRTGHFSVPYFLDGQRGDMREDGQAPTRRRRQAEKAGPDNTILSRA